MYPDYVQKYIPPEFDLSKYDKCINMGLIGWVENIAGRLFIYEVATKGIKELTDEQLTLLEKVSQDHICAGILSETPARTLIEGLIKDDKANATRIVKELSYLDLYSLMDAAKDEDLDKLYSEITLPVFPILAQGVHAELNKTVQVNINSDAETAWLMIDMDCSKQEIMNSFKCWLELKKEESEKNKVQSKHEKKINIFNETAFRNWHTAKVLPYIDLVSWNMLKGNKLSEKMIKNILFASPTDSDSTLGTSTKPYVKKLMSQSTFRRMISVLSE